MFWTEPGTRQRRYLNVPGNQFREFTYVTRVKSRLAPWIRLQVERMRRSDGQMYTPLIDGYKTMDVVRLTLVKKKYFVFVEHDRKLYLYYYVILLQIPSLSYIISLDHCRL